MESCRHCKKPITISPEMRDRIRKFKAEFYFISQKQLADLFGISTVRMSEIIRGDENKGGL